MPGLSSTSRSRTARRDRLASRTVASAALVALVALVLGGCTVGAQGSPVPVQAPTVGSPSPSSGPGVPLTVQVYLVRGDRLARVSRTVAPGAGLEPALAGLAKPLSAGELAAGLRSALPATGSPLSGRLVDAVARVSVPKGFARVSVREQELAMAQLVFTVTADTLASSVQLVQGERELSTPDGTGRLVDRPVTRLDYAAYRPAPS
ncbi:hypothetical protein GCM10027517_27190 [Phycicoccus ginsengisoli]